MVARRLLASGAAYLSRPYFYCLCPLPRCSAAAAEHGQGIMLLHLLTCRWIRFNQQSPLDHPLNMLCRLPRVSFGAVILRKHSTRNGSSE